VAVFQGRAGSFNVVGDQAQHRLVVDRHARHRFQIHAGARQSIGYPRQLAGPVGQVDGEVTHESYLRYEVVKQGKESRTFSPLGSPAPSKAFDTRIPRLSGNPAAVRLPFPLTRHWSPKEPIMTLKTASPVEASSAKQAEDLNPFHIAEQQFDRAAGHMP